METVINNKLICSFDPCYNPSDVNIPDGESLPIIEWVEKYRNTVQNKEDVIWLLCRKEFMTDRDLRLFAVWCAREALKLVETPDQRSINACNIAEKFANGEASQEELNAARDAAWDAAWGAASGSAWGAAWGAASGSAWGAAWGAARDAAWGAASGSAWGAAWGAARDAQINKLMTYFQ